MQGAGKRGRAVAVALLILWFFGPDRNFAAQEGRATARGTALSQSGIPIANARVTATSQTGQGLTITVNEQGEFEFPELASGTYEFEAFPHGNEVYQSNALL